jgi:hypothetical protein
MEKSGINVVDERMAKLTSLASDYFLGSPETSFLKL